MIVDFGEYLPDLPDISNPGATVAKNCLPFKTSYKQFPSATNYSNALTARAQGTFSCKDKDGNAYNFAGDASKLYQLSDQTYSEVSKVGGYSTNTDEGWMFGKSGETVIATNFTNNPQAITLGDANFADLTSSLRARYVDGVRDFVFFANTYDSTDGAVPQRVKWSAKGDPTDYTPATATQAGSADLIGKGGWNQAIVGGESGVVFQESSIWTILYTGVPGIVFQVDEVEKGRGTPSPQSVVPVGRFIFYLGQDGFYVFDRSSGVSQPIGDGKVDATFAADLDQAYWYRVNGIADPENKMVIWAYPGSGNSGGNPNKLLIYNWAVGRWASAEVDTEVLVSALSQGYSLDSLDTVSSSIDALEFSLDSRVWTGGNLLLSCFTTEHKLANFNGSAMTAYLETREVQPMESHNATITSARALVDGGVTTLAFGTRANLSESVAYGSALSAQSSGRYRPRSTGRYHRVKATISGGFTDAIGIEIEVIRRRGKR